MTLTVATLREIIADLPDDAIVFVRESGRGTELLDKDDVFTNLTSYPSRSEVDRFLLEWDDELEEAKREVRSMNAKWYDFSTGTPAVLFYLR